MNLFDSVNKLPPASQFPTNIGSATFTFLAEDLQQSSDYLIVAGYSSLDFLITKIGNRGEHQNIKIVLGNEPLYSELQKQKTFKKITLTDEIRDYWLEKGISPTQCGLVIRLINLIEKGNVSFKILERLH